MKEYQITVLKGDGIGPEIVDQAIKVLNKTAEKFDFKVNYQEEYIGGAAIDATGEPLPQKTVDSCKASDAVILGAVGGPKWDSLSGRLYQTNHDFHSKKRVRSDPPASSGDLSGVWKNYDFLQLLHKRRKSRVMG